MRTTEPRALLPDAWGFVCPVHTPDGAPCGLLNHLAMPVEIVTHYQDSSKVIFDSVNTDRQIILPITQYFTKFRGILIYLSTNFFGRF